MERNLLIIKQVEDEGPGLIEKIFTTHGWAIETIELSRGEELPSGFDEVGAVVVLGGPMNVHEEAKYPFLIEEEHYIRKALIGEIPLLGICLGAQLLAKTCGARVKKAPQREIGWCRVKKTGEGENDSLFSKSPDHMQVFQWHEDTFDIPEGAVLLVTGKDCRNQAFRVGQNAYGLQFHIEVTEDMIQSWFQSGEEAFVEKILSDTRNIKEKYDTQADQILLNFMHITETSLKLRKVIKLFVDEGKEARKRRPALWWNSRERVLTTTKDDEDRR